ncbi:MAG: DUF3079 domain-containing protein [Rubrivivax sp.]|jgi:hypothetical protein|nr:DUF3079 domain-containing protein [Rubrivivax sp.]MBP6319821.1 DUF3079 domain-containing protein [Rubrivivax sp.]MBP6465316.1 DUF3079 domain-containing protein [Rubrivivax sp.]
MSRLGASSAGRHPGAGCWFCDRFSAADALMTGSGSMAPLSAYELFGEDCMTWGRAGQHHEPPARPPVPAPGLADR